MAAMTDVSAMKRRDFLGGALALPCAASLLAAGPALAAPASLDPINPDIRYGACSNLWGDDIEQAIKDVARLGLQGLEPYRKNVMPWVDTPAHFRQFHDKLVAAGIVLIDVANGGPGMTVNFTDPTKTAKSIAEHVSFARDYIAPYGCDHWKVNMGPRPKGGPDGGPSDDDLKRLADTLNEIGRQTIAMGIRLGPHPHVGGPMEREHEVRRVMELTDPRYVWLTTDTGHLVLGGMDPVQIISDYFPRVAEVHMKDCPALYRGNTATPHPKNLQTLYRNLGAGGVDFPAVFKLLRDRHFKGWVALDVDGPLPGDGTGDTEDNVVANMKYLRDALRVKLPVPTRG